MSKNKKNPGGLVFSTDPDYKPFSWDDEPQDETSAEKHKLRIHLDRLKGGKTATVIKGFSGSEDALNGLAKNLKVKCGVGGSAKDGEIILQGDHRDKVLQYLIDNGYKDVKKAGG